MVRPRDPQKAIATAQRDANIIRLRLDGWRWADIATTVGLSMSRCHEVFEQHRRDIPQSVLASWRDQELDVLTRGIKSLLAIAENEGESARSRTEAWKEVRQHSESRRKIMGVDAPVKRELEVIDSAFGDARIEREISAIESELAAIERAKNHAS